MRPKRATEDRIDVLDLAAIWPCCAQFAGPALPPIDARGTSERDHPDEVDRHGIW